MGQDIAQIVIDTIRKREIPESEISAIITEKIAACNGRIQQAKAAHPGHTLYWFPNERQGVVVAHGHERQAGGNDTRGEIHADRMIAILSHPEVKKLLGGDAPCDASADNRLTFTLGNVRIQATAFMVRGEMHVNIEREVSGSKQSNALSQPVSRSIAKKRDGKWVYTPIK